MFTVLGIHLILAVLPISLLGITIIHHDKPENIHMKMGKFNNISKQPQQQQQSVRTIIATSERHKRLLPYINYYYRPENSENYDYNQNYYQHPVQPQDSNKFTPFLESNALPGKFTPIVNNINNNNNNIPEKIENSEYFLTEKEPNYSALYDKLAQLKFVQKIRSQLYPNQQQFNYIPYQEYKIVQPSKMIVETYTPKNIDIPPPAPSSPPQHEQYQSVPITYPETEPYVHQTTYENDYNQKQYLREKPIVRKPIIILQRKPQHPHKLYHQTLQQLERPVFYLIPQQKSKVITEENYEKFPPPPPPPTTLPQENFDNYDVQQQYEKPAPITIDIPTKTTNNLGNLLKQLQDSNALPHTLTSDNIDNSIKTLVKILNQLKKQQKLTTKPIVVDEDDYVVPEPVKHEEIPGTITQTFPANTVEGGTPGKPGIDYPALSSIPQTSFNCKTQRYKGFFGDPHTNCQVWHYCDLNGGQASFLCPNGTIFSQVALTCDWWYNVKCSSTAQLYVLNERLYKYILPFSPKFPEDYSGPLVDKYLALKFKEMEEKMAKEKKGKVEDVKEKDESNQLQTIQNESKYVASDES